MGTLYSTCRAAAAKDNDALLAAGGEIGTSMADSFCQRDRIRIGRRGLSRWDDNIVEDSEKLSLSQRSNDFRRDTRWGGKEGEPMVHRKCCEV